MGWQDIRTSLYRKFLTFGGVLSAHTDFQTHPFVPAIEWSPPGGLSSLCATPCAILTVNLWALFCFQMSTSLPSLTFIDLGPSCRKHGDRGNLTMFWLWYPVNGGYLLVHWANKSYSFILKLVLSGISWAYLVSGPS